MKKSAPARKSVSVRSTKSPSRSPRSNKVSWAHKIFAVLIILFVLLTVAPMVALAGMKVMGWHFFIDDRNVIQFTQAVELQGSVHFTALKPEPKDKGEVQLAYQMSGETGWMNVSLPLKQDAAWQLKVLPGVDYKVQATLVIDGKEVKKSEVIEVFAPAYHVEVPLEINWKDLPNDVVKGSTTKLGGELVVHGYIPATAVAEVYALNPKYFQKELYQVTPEVLQGSTLIASVNSPKENSNWTWEKAVPLEEYMVVAVLKDQGKIIGISEEEIKADASEISLQHVINSTAQPPATGSKPQVQVLGATTLLTDAIAQTTGQSPTSKSAISGTVSLQGPKQKDTSLLMLWRKPGESDFKVINRYMYPSHQGTAWSWPEAQVGQRYEIMAVLQVDNNNVSGASNPISVTAPATNVNFTLNTYYVIPRTSSLPVNEVCVDNNGSQSTAIIRLPKIQNAAHYWIQVGRNPGESGIYNQKVSASDQDVKVRVRVDNNKTNYVKYSYATCENCQSDQNFAPFSDNVGFTCS